MGEKEESNVGSFPGFDTNTARCWWDVLLSEDCHKHFHAKRYRALGTCFRTVSGISFIPKALLTTGPLMVCTSTERVVNFGSLAGLYSRVHIIINHRNICR
jgi:hypothetical protein